MFKISKTYISMVFFFITGVFMLASVWFLQTDAGVMVWRSAKVFYFLGLVAFIFNFVFAKK